MADENIPDWDRPSSGDNIPDWDRPESGASTTTATAGPSRTPETDRAISQQTSQFSIDRTPVKAPVVKPWWQQLQAFAKKPSPEWMQPTEKFIREQKLVPKEALPVYWMGKEAEWASRFLPSGVPRKIGEAVGGGIEGLAAAGSEFTTPANLALGALTGGLGRVGTGLISGVFLGQAVYGTPAQWRALKAAPTIAEKARIATGMAASYMPALGFAEIARGKGGAPEAKPGAEAELPPPPTSPFTPAIADDEAKIPLVSETAMPPPPMAPGGIIGERNVGPVIEQSREQPGVTYASPVKSAESVLKRNEGAPVGSGTSLFPLNKGAAGARPGEEPVSTGQTVAPQTPATDAVTPVESLPLRIAEARERLKELQQAQAQGRPFSEGMKQHMTALESFLKGAAPDVEQKVQHEQFGKPGYTAVDDERVQAAKQVMSARTVDQILQAAGYTPVEINNMPSHRAIQLSSQLQEQAADILKNVTRASKAGVPAPDPDQRDTEIKEFRPAAGFPQVADVEHEELTPDQEAAEMERLRQEDEQERVQSADEHMARGGDELVDVLKQHGLPPIPEAKSYTGELKNIREMFKGGTTGGTNKYGNLVTGTGEKLRYQEVFKKGGGSLESLTQTLRRKGFKNPDGSRVETDDDTLNLIQNRLLTGKKVVGDEAGAQALEEQSYGDYQEPMRSLLPGIKKTAEQLHDDIGAAAKAEESLPKTKNEPGRQIVSTSQDEEQVDRLLGKDAYKNSIVNVVIKELLQNGFDAVREGGASEAKPGQISIDYDYGTRIINVTDNGVGMTPETIVNAFLRTGGTKKSGDFQNTSGGLGVAKLAFLKGSKRIKLVTVKDGLKTVMDVDQSQIRSKQIPLDSTYTDEPNGTMVEVKIPEDYIDENGEKRQVWFDTDPEFLKNPLFGPVEVTLNGEKAPMGIHTTDWQKDNTFNFKWGHADVYVDPRPLGKYSWGEEKYPKYSVMSAGLHQFDIPWSHIFDKGSDQIPHNMVIDVRPHVDTKHPQYPFNNQREGWRGTVDRDAKAIYSYLKRQGLEQRLKKAQETFSKVQVIPHVDVVDLGKDLSADQVKLGDATKGAKGSVTLPKITSIDVDSDKVTTNYASGKKDVQSHERFNKTTFSAEREIDFEKTKLDTSHLNPQDPLYHNNTNVDFLKIKGAPELHAKVSNLLVQFMREFGRRFGKDPTARPEYNELTETTPGKAWFGGISYDKEYAGLNIVNPFKAIWINPAGLSKGAMLSGPKRAAYEQLHTFLHEITHVPERNEGGRFTREETDNVGRMLDFPHGKFADALEEIYTKHWDTLNEIRTKYWADDTANSAESFKAGSPLGAKSRGGKGADKGLPGEHVSEDEPVQKQRSTSPGRAEKSDRPTGSLGDIIAGQAAASKRAKRAAAPGTAPGTPQAAAAPGPVTAPATAGAGGPVAAPAFREGIRDTLGGIKQAVEEKPPLKPQAEPSEAHPAREPTSSETDSPRTPMSEDQMGKLTRDTFARLSASVAEGRPPRTVATMSRNEIIDSGRTAIRAGVDPDVVVNSNQVPNDQKFAVARAHSEDLRDIADQANREMRKNNTQENKDASEMAFADFANWNREHLERLRTITHVEHPEMEHETYDPRSYTDLRGEMYRKNNRDFTPGERHKAFIQVREIEKADAERNALNEKFSEELKKRAPDTRPPIWDSNDLFSHVADILKDKFPCS